MTSYLDALAVDVPAQLVVVDEASRPVPCRVHLTGPDGNPVKVDGMPFWQDHFGCMGTVEMRLPPGRYTYEIERGPEHESLRGHWQIAHGEPSELKVTLKRLEDLTRLGWYSGDLHVHRPLTELPVLLPAENLHIAPVITWWNERNWWSSQDHPAGSVLRTPDGRFYDVMAGEDERGGGALLYFGLSEPLPISDASREYPSSIKYLNLAKQRDPEPWVDIEKPFWRDVPLWLASDHVDSIGIAHNHLWRGGGLHHEAWGRSRDEALWPGPQGNGRWTQEIYYRLLNCGIRIPPSAGSASGVLDNPLGYNRCYVQLPGALDYAAWWQGLREGRVFVTNGPLLLVTASGESPGHVFSTKTPSLRLQIEGRVVCREPIELVEVIADGQAVKVIRGIEPKHDEFSSTVQFDRSGWFLVRAICRNQETFRFASTGPFYVEVGDKRRRIDRQSAEFFLGWSEERLAELSQILKSPQKVEVLQHHQRAVNWWQQVVQRAD